MKRGVTNKRKDNVKTQKTQYISQRLNDGSYSSRSGLDVIFLDLSTIFEVNKKSRHENLSTINIAKGKFRIQYHKRRLISPDPQKMLRVFPWQITISDILWVIFHVNIENNEIRFDNDW